jgi:hypothetical protein
MPIAAQETPKDTKTKTIIKISIFYLLRFPLFSRESKISILRPIMAGRRIRIKKAKTISKAEKDSPYIFQFPPKFLRFAFRKKRE